MARENFQISRMHVGLAAVWRLTWRVLRMSAMRAWLVGLSVAACSALGMYVMTAPPDTANEAVRAWRISLGLSAVAALAGIIGAMIGSISARRTRFALAKSLGATGGTIFRSIMLESACIGLAGFAAGAAAGLAARCAQGLIEWSAGMGSFSGRIILADLPTCLAWLAGLSMALVLAGAFVPAISAARLTVVQAAGQED
ncbi:MAG: hypothetical protein HZA50_05860 [Planctomycetes bacterium]|nr:hypothetical protein [Planctomycetota bacterium]